MSPQLAPIHSIGAVLRQIIVRLHFRYFVNFQVILAKGQKIIRSNQSRLGPPPEKNQKECTERLPIFQRIECHQSPSLRIVAIFADLQCWCEQTDQLNS